MYIFIHMDVFKHVYIDELLPRNKKKTTTKIYAIYDASIYSSGFFFACCPAIETR